MTETVSKNFQQWVGDGVSEVYTLSNVILLDEAYLAVYLDDITQTIATDYSVGIEAQIASVTFLTPPAAGQRISIVREEPLEQNTDLTTINTFRAEGFEGALDAIVRQIYRLWHRLSRSLTLPDSALDGSGLFDARLNRIGNVADPVAEQDAVTKAFADDTYALQSVAGSDMFKATYDTDGDGKVNEAITADIAPWSGLTGIPASFTPATHSHTATDVDDFNTASDARIASSAQDVSIWEAGTGITEGVVSPAKIAAAIATIAPGGGDMIKATYDSNNNGKVDAADAADVAPWAGLTGVPATFTPSVHTHIASDLTDFNTSSDARISAAVNVSVQAYDADTAKTDVAQTFSALQASSIETLSDGATITPTGTKNAHQITLGGNRTMAAPAIITAGATYLFKIIQDGTGSRTLAWDSAYDWPGGTAPTLTATATGIDVISGFSFDGVSIQILTPGQDFS
ncbi:phage tail fiber protein [Pararhizobium sp. IMCC21322]|uniref:phage tail fiber domain-containing protein n=1 Tax=Pararhizobium sp. IMCC21322 TaxID=3067903 RepID=UPI0027421907|nr:phage tail fiber protein [Pararhizobium sp. IMCC21322]